MVFSPYKPDERLARCVHARGLDWKTLQGPEVASQKEGFPTVVRAHIVRIPSPVKNPLQRFHVAVLDQGVQVSPTSFRKRRSQGSLIHLRGLLRVLGFLAQRNEGKSILRQVRLLLHIWFQIVSDTVHDVGGEGPWNGLACRRSGMRNPKPMSILARVLYVSNAAHAWRPVSPESSSVGNIARRRERCFTTTWWSINEKMLALKGSYTRH